MKILNFAQFPTLESRQKKALETGFCAFVGFNRERGLGRIMARGDFRPQDQETVKRLYKQLQEGRARCLAENRNPSPAERQMALKITGRIKQFESNNTGEPKMNDAQLLDYMARTIQAEGRQPTESERQTALDLCNGVPFDQIPEYWLRSVRPPTKPSLNGGSYGGSGGSFKSAGEFFQAVARSSGPAQAVDPRLSRAFFNAATGLQESLPSEGGFLVQTDFASQLLTRAYETGQVARRCRRIPISSNSNSIKIPGVDETSRATGSRWGGIRSYWIGEADDMTASRPKFRMIELNLKKLIGLCYTTDELLADASALEAIIFQAFSEDFGFMLDDSVINGTGAGQPLGIMNGPCLVRVSKEAGQIAKTVVFENIVNLYSRLWAPSRSNAVWLINQDVEPQLYGMGITVGMGGSPVYMPPGGLSGQPYGTLFGRPVIAIEQCQTLGTAGDIILGDFGEYLLCDKGAMQSASSIHVRFANDEQVFRFVYLVDGMPLWNAALTPFKGSNSVAPFVTLESRT